jgi:hypothetical protein
MVSFVIDTDVVILRLCLMESICHFDFCYLYQNRFPDHSPCYIESIAFLGAADDDEVIGIAVALCAVDNHVVR